jgi:uncharacterized membrane protein YgcG
MGSLLSMSLRQSRISLPLLALSYCLGVKAEAMPSPNATGPGRPPNGTHMHPSITPEVTVQASNSRLIAILMHGQAFRNGGQFSSKTAESPSTQLRAINSTRNHIFMPLLERGWKLEVFIDAVVMDAKRFDELSGLLRTSWGGDFVKPNNVRVRPTHHKTQYQGICYSLNWINTTASPGILRRAGHTLLSRIDLIFKPDLNLPLKPRIDRVTVLGYMPDAQRINDVLFWIPRDLVLTFKFMKAQLRDMNLHYAHKAIPCAVMYHSLHNSDSMLGWNPAYKMASRKGNGRNAAPATKWGNLEAEFVRLREEAEERRPGSAPLASSRHRVDYLPRGLDGQATVQLTIELEGIPAPVGGLSVARGVSVLAEKHEVYVLHRGDSDSDSDSGSGSSSSSSSSSSGGGGSSSAKKAVAAVHVVLPVQIDGGWGRQEVTWAAPRSTMRTSTPHLRNSTATSVVVVRSPGKASSPATPANFVPGYEKWKLKYGKKEEPKKHNNDNDNDNDAKANLTAHERHEAALEAARPEKRSAPPKIA